MLLRESSRELDQTVNIDAVVNPHSDQVEEHLNGSRQGAEGGDCCGHDPFGFPAATDLLRFASAANRSINVSNPAKVPISERDQMAALSTARAGLVAAVGTEAMMEAAATVAIFNGLVRVADGTGIQLDGALTSASTTLRDELGLNTMAGAANTPNALNSSERPTSTINQDRENTVSELFSD